MAEDKYLTGVNYTSYKSDYSYNYLLLTFFWAQETHPFFSSGGAFPNLPDSAKGYPDSAKVRGFQGFGLPHDDAALIRAWCVNMSGSGGGHPCNCIYIYITYHIICRILNSIYHISKYHIYIYVKYDVYTNIYIYICTLMHMYIYIKHIFPRKIP